MSRESEEVFWLVLAAATLFLLFGALSYGSDTCFSPNKGCDAKLVSLLQGAQTSLDIAIYDINLPNVTQAILDAQKRGIKVRMVVDQRQSKEKFSTVSQLAKLVPVRCGKQAGSGIMHNKFVVVDGKRLETGSFNFTRHATDFNHENQFYSDEPPIVESYAGYFTELWNGGVPCK